MTWEELKQKAKELGCCLFISKCKCDNEEFDEESLSLDNGNFYQDGTVLLHNIKPEQMYAIMEALK